ncbi:MAG: CbiX/SirB N-terminal domain-containing protein [Abditibacteriales bacterium]|nr:CbiX/SirB N-terminal domain-containing protein [Abditibacteriales bacterium]MDW8368533.1 CbiX/SirB N-terminal domain-containing protein [Abditibacteriales bacterium]
MKAVIVLVMHGVPPNDFPRPEMGEYFGLQARLMSVREGREALQQRYNELDAKMRSWRRTPQNDPFHAGSHALAHHLRQVTGWEVIVAFNEFCDPNVDDALEMAAAQRPDKIVVITPMMTRGGGHSEVDIPTAVQRAQARHPQIPIVYAWPFDVGEVAHFLSQQIYRFIASNGDLRQQTEPVGTLAR